MKPAPLPGAVGPLAPFAVALCSDGRASGAVARGANGERERKARAGETGGPGGDARDNSAVRSPAPLFLPSSAAAQWLRTASRSDRRWLQATFAGSMGTMGGKMARYRSDGRHRWCTKHISIAVELRPTGGPDG
jgi:hypothetical protein